MSTGEDIRTALLADGTVSGLIDTRVYEATIPAGDELPFIWLMRASTETAETLEAEGIPYREWWDVECVSTDLDEAITIADAVRACLNGITGTIGEGTYQWVEVTDQAEEYITRNQAADEHLYVSSLRVEVINQ